MDRPHVAEILNSCSFFVLPSKHETFGTVIIEALSCGKPVVTTDIGGQREIIKDSSIGYLVKSQDEYSLFHGLNSMAENFKNYDSAYLREYAKSYSYENIARKMKKLYLDCLGS
jgi:glycosyltransferase involved in cell wall biosynthesis